MPQRSRHSSSLDRLSRKVFETTGFPISVLVKLFVISVIAIVGIRLTVLYTNAEPTGEISEQEALDSKRLTSEEQFIVVSELPKDFGEKLLSEKIGILESKTEAGETLARSGGHYSERATDQLVLIYGTLSRLQDLAGLDSQKSYDRLAELRQQAFAVGNEKRVASADFLRALAVTSRLKRHNQRTDFRFATEAILNLRRKNLVNINEIKQLYSEAIKLHDTSSQQDNTAVFLTVLGDKLLDSPVREISDLGLDLKDHSNYALYYEAIDEQPYSTQESKLQFFKELFAKIEKAPPQSPETY